MNEEKNKRLPKISNLIIGSTLGSPKTRYEIEEAFNLKGRPLYQKNKKKNKTICEEMVENNQLIEIDGKYLCSDMIFDLVHGNTVIEPEKDKFAIAFSFSSDNKVDALITIIKKENRHIFFDLDLLKNSFGSDFYEHVSEISILITKLIYTLVIKDKYPHKESDCLEMTRSILFGIPGSGPSKYVRVILKTLKEMKISIPKVNWDFKEKFTEEENTISKLILDF